MAWHACHCVPARVGRGKGDRDGERPDQLPLWVLENCDVGYELRRAIHREMAARFADPAPPQPPRECARCGQVRSRLDGWCRRAAMRLHPDRGGADEAMAALTTCATSCERRWIERAGRPAW